MHGEGNRVPGPTLREVFRPSGRSEDLSRHMGMRGSHGMSSNALPNGSSLTIPTTFPRLLVGCRIATTLAHALSSGRSLSLKGRTFS